MKTIFEVYSEYKEKYRYPYLREIFGIKHDPLFYKIQGYIDQAYEYFGEDNLPDNFIDIVHSGEDYIIENLNSHDYNLLYKKIKHYFGDYVGEYDKVYDKGETDKNSFYLEIVNNTILKDKEFLKLLQFFNYRLREYRDELHTAIIEPIYSKRIEIDSPVLYHFTTKDKLEHILQKGLKPKRAKYANTLERLYLYYPKGKLNLKGDKNVIEFVKALYDGEIPNNLVVLRIDLHEIQHYANTAFNLYQDTAMNFDEAVFTQHFIPACFIKEVKIKGLNF